MMKLLTQMHLLSIALFFNHSALADEEYEKDISLQSVPEQVLKVAQDSYPEIIFISAEIFIKDSKTFYELEGVQVNKQVEITISEDGQIISDKDD